MQQSFAGSSQDLPLQQGDAEHEPQRMAEFQARLDALRQQSAAHQGQALNMQLPHEINHEPDQAFR